MITPSRNGRHILSMIEIDIKIEDLLHWARDVEDIHRKIPPTVADALNAVGVNVLNKSVQWLSESTGLTPADITSLVSVKEATSQDLTWKMDATAATLMAGPSQPWTSPGDKTFDSQQLLNIVTSGDEHVCPICEAAAEASPYTVEDIQALAAKWANYQPPTPNLVVGDITNLLHPRCRCATQPWQVYRRLNVTFPDNPGEPPVVLSMRELGETLARELGGVLKVK